MTKWVLSQEYNVALNFEKSVITIWHINRFFKKRKQQHLALIHDENSWQTRNRREHLQTDKGHHWKTV